MEERKESDEGATAEQPLRLVARHADVKVRQQLQAYADALDELQLFMRVPMTAANTVVYYTIPVTSTINDSLKGSAATPSLASHHTTAASHRSDGFYSPSVPSVG